MTVIGGYWGYENDIKPIYCLDRKYRSNFQKELCQNTKNCINGTENGFGIGFEEQSDRNLLPPNLTVEGNDGTQMMTN